VWDDVTKSGFAGAKLITPTLRSLFDSLQVTGYFGSVYGAGGIEGVTLGNPTIIKASGHGRKTGETVRLCFHPKDGMQEINGRKGTVTVIDANTFSLNIDTRGATPLVTPTTNAYWTPSLVFDLFDASETKHAADPARYPTRYAYFGEQLAESCLAGRSSDGFTQSEHVANIRDRYCRCRKSSLMRKACPSKCMRAGHTSLGTSICQATAA
jgi:hypothetical protein